MASWLQEQFTRVLTETGLFSVSLCVSTYFISPRFSQKGTFSKNAKNYKPRGLIMAPIDKTNYNQTRRCEVHPHGQHAATHYECLAEFQSQDGNWELFGVFRCIPNSFSKSFKFSDCCNMNMLPCGTQGWKPIQPASLPPSHRQGQG